MQFPLLFAAQLWKSYWVIAVATCMSMNLFLIKMDFDISITDNEYLPLHGIHLQVTSAILRMALYHSYSAILCCLVPFNGSLAQHIRSHQSKSG